MPYGTVQADVIGTSVAGSNLGAGNASIMKNRIINGAMVIDQRNAGALINPAVAGSYYVDRWAYNATQSSKFSIGQNAGSVTPPVGFTNYLGVTSLSAYSIISTDTFQLYQGIEGFNTADLGFGTANAKTVTLSAWVYSNLTGTFGGAISNSAVNRAYPFTYSIPAANTWTQISVTIAGDTSGAWLTNNGPGIRVYFSLGSGSTYSGTAGSWASADYRSATGATSVVGTSGATFYITGVQLEVGSSATGFEYVNYQTSLANCQRYFYKVNASQTLVGVTAYDATTVYDGSPNPYPVPMRTTPSITNSGTFTLNDGLGASVATTPSWTIQSVGFRVSGVGVSTGLVSGRLYYLTLASNAQISISAEL